MVHYVRVLILIDVLSSGNCSTFDFCACFPSPLHYRILTKMMLLKYYGKLFGKLQHIRTIRDYQACSVLSVSNFVLFSNFPRRMKSITSEKVCSIYNEEKLYSALSPCQNFPEVKPGKRIGSLFGHDDLISRPKTLKLPQPIIPLKLP